MVETTDELERVVVQACQGEKHAEGILYERFHRFVERRLRDARRRRNWFWIDDVDDTVQDIFVQFFGALRGGKFEFQSENQLEGFLIRTSFFVVMNLKDKRPRERVFSSFGRADDDEGGLVDTLAFSGDAHAERDRADCLRLLVLQVRKLGESRRDVIERSLAGQKVREIVAATGKSPASISGLKFNALKDLKLLLEESGFLEQCADAFDIVEGS